jgi:hypothetical protein
MVITQTVSTDRSKRNNTWKIMQCQIIQHNFLTYHHYHQHREQHLKETSIIVSSHEMLYDQDILSIHH